MGLGGLVLGSLIIFLKGMRRMMFQLSGFYYRVSALGLKALRVWVPFRVPASGSLI